MGLLAVKTDDGSKEVSLIIRMCTHYPDRLIFCCSDCKNHIIAMDQNAFDKMNGVFNGWLAEVLCQHACSKRLKKRG